MSYTHFSTQNADYFLTLEPHGEELHEDIFRSENISSLDAIVLEDVGVGSAIFDNVEYRQIMRAAKDNGNRIYTLDIPGSQDIDAYVEYERNIVIAGAVGAIGCTAAAHVLKRLKKMTRRRMLGLFGGTLACLGLAALGIAPKLSQYSLVESGEASWLAKKVISAETSMIKTEAITLRNAVSAKKTEEFLAPMLMERLGRKPKIALVYGAYHAGMQDCIEDRDFRNEVLEYFSDVLAEGRKSPTYEETLNTIYEYIVVESRNGFDMVKYPTGLF